MWSHQGGWTGSGWGRPVAVSGGGGAAWAPSDLGTALKAWYDFGDLATITKDGSNNVTAVMGKSGAGPTLANDGTLVYGATALQGAKPGVTFPGGTTRFAAIWSSASTAWNAFCVYQTTTNTNFARLISFASAVNGTDFSGDSGSYALLLRDNGSGEAVSSYFGSEKAVSATQSFNSSNAMFASVNNDTTTNTAYLNGVAGSGVSFTPGTITPVQLQIGYSSGTAFTGTISEVLIVAGAMTTTDRQKAEGYLAWKWGLQSQLPAGHPYLSAAP